MTDNRMDDVFSNDNTQDIFSLDAIQNVESRRAEQIKEFSLDLDIDALVPDVEKTEEVTTPTVETVPMQQAIPDVKSEPAPGTHRLKQPQKSQKSGKAKNKFVGRLAYVLTVIVLSLSIAAIGLSYFFDASGLGASDGTVEIEIPQGAYTQQVATILKENGLIDNTLFFRIYAKLAKLDGKWQSGMFVLAPNMGYSGMVEQLQTKPPRESVKVTIPEGYTVEEIARLLAEKKVCSQEEFYEAVVKGDFDYDFVKAIPTAANGAQHANRIYRLEGYLFPDTYEFYVGSTGDMVVNKMLANFDKKMTPQIRKQISDKGWTIDQAIIFASIIQGEAGKKEDMYAVSRVLTNRMKPNSGFSKLECDSTRYYINELLPTYPGIEVKASSYNTYTREGLPVGAINNPGILAIEAALNPSDDAKYTGCYYFATDYDTGITYYSKTLAQHEAICRKYGIGGYR